MRAGVTLMLDICKMEPAAVEIYRQQVPTLCKILRSLLVGGFSADYDVSGITDPFLQVKVRRWLGVASGPPCMIIGSQALQVCSAPAMAGCAPFHSLTGPAVCALSGAAAEAAAHPGQGQCGGQRRHERCAGPGGHQHRVSAQCRQCHPL